MKKIFSALKALVLLPVLLCVAINAAAARGSGVSVLRTDSLAFALNADQCAAAEEKTGASPCEPSGSAVCVTRSPAPAALLVTAVNAKNGLTVQNARVRIIENGASARCLGSACRIAAPFLPDPRLPVPPPFGTCTLIVTAPGYIATALVGCLVYPGQSRPVSVTLLPDDGSIADPIVSFSESPPADWLNGLLIEPRTPSGG